LFQSYGRTFTPIEIKSDYVNNVAEIYKNLTDGIKISGAMSEYILKQVITLF